MNTNKIDLIKAEVEKLKLCTMDEHMKFYSECAEAEYNALCKVEEIIDSLQEESKFKVGQYLKQGDTIVKILEVSDDGYHCDSAFIPFSAQDQWELVKEPVSKIWHDMSDEAENGRNTIIIDPKGFYGAVLRKGGSQLRNHNKERYVKWAYIDDIINITNKEEPVSKDLGQAIDTYLATYFGGEKEKQDWPFLKKMATYFTNLQKEKDDEEKVLIYKHGFDNCKEQIMAKAVDGVITFDYYGDDDKTYGCIAHDSFCLEDFGLKDTDKVKMILIKED